ncbi:SDR family oxidoreductase [Methylocystis bryophila]|uniref:Short-chain dehydrogenase n=1 Tax=Methylocystis bryophila TaxID=655015 RepID=A0A1W6MUZ9_9HYPH|nr:SDR family oxidoreductase [Methylocystis bryophila]ARN81405.1 short-chain dehydrogenase [Methylocystis bryophila]BDV37401.1 short-chain dehydrogenase [Methylocystis bryophila]
MSEHWVVSGASRGIGLELVRQLAARGERVTASLRDEAARDVLLASLAAQHARIETKLFDMRDGEAILSAAKTVAGPIDVLIANAGVFGPKPQTPLQMDFEAALDVFSINTLGPLRLVRALLPQLAGAANPRIVLVSSELGASADVRPSSAVYAASKIALNKFAQCLAEELKPKGIVVIALSPGWVRTDMGGPNATLSVQESGSGILATIDALTIAESGSFIDYQGERLAW